MEVWSSEPVRRAGTTRCSGALCPNYLAADAVPPSRSLERERWVCGWRLWWWRGEGWGGGRIPRARAWGFLPSRHRLDGIDEEGEAGARGGGVEPSRPRGVLRGVDEPLGMRHQAKDTAC